MCTRGVRVYPQCSPETAFIFFARSLALLVAILGVCMVGIYPQTRLKSKQGGAGWR